MNCSFRLFPIRIVLQFLSLTKKKSTKKILFHICFVLDFMQKLNIFSTFLLAFDNHVLPSVRPFSVCAHFARLLNEIRKFPFSFLYFCPTGIDAKIKTHCLFVFLQGRLSYLGHIHMLSHFYIVFHCTNYLSFSCSISNYFPHWTASVMTFFSHFVNSSKYQPIAIQMAHFHR